ncbi:MAG: hypothetical protein MJ137_01645 [Clostridia bacterium]|nr:hypothetical protein [Clostridia bacterium]
MDRYRKAKESHLPSGFREITEKKTGSAGTVRRYAMTKKAGKNWLSGFMSRSSVIDPDEIKSGRIELTASEKEKDSAKKVIAILIGTLSVLLLVGAAAVLFGLMRIENVVVDGETGYTAEELMEASGMQYGKSLLIGRTKSSDPAEKLTPLESCTVKIELPGTVVFTVRETEPEIYTEIHGNWFSMSSGLRVVSMEKTPDAFESAGLIRVTLPEIVTATSGSTAVFADGADGEYIVSFVRTVIDAGITDRCNMLFLDLKYGITVTVDGSYRLYFGSTEDARLKLDAALRIIEEEKSAGTECASVDLSDPSRIGVKKLESLDPMTR